MSRAVTMNAKGHEAGREGSFIVRPWRRDDIARISRLHEQGLSDSFLPHLGAAFLVEMYAALITDESVFGYVMEDGIVNGYIVCTTNREDAANALRRRKWKLLTASLPRFVRRPSLALRLMRGLGYDHIPHPCAAELIVIIVAESGRSRGIGKRLLDTALQEMRRRGIHELSVTVASDNTGARKFYETNDFALRGSFELFGRMMAEYSRSC